MLGLTGAYNFLGSDTGIESFLSLGTRRWVEIEGEEGLKFLESYWLLNELEGFMLLIYSKKGLTLDEEGFSSIF